MYNEKARQLFEVGTIPRGFILGFKMYLFDSILGCVYVVCWTRLHFFNLFNQRIARFKENVPFEDFFNCPFNLPINIDRNQYPQDRCAESRRTIQKRAELPTVDDTSSKEKSSSQFKWAIWVLFGMGAVLPLIAGVIVWRLYSTDKSQKKSFTGKSSMQSTFKEPPKKKGKQSASSSKKSQASATGKASSANSSS